MIDRFRIADALEACDWSGSPIGNKEILKAAVRFLREVDAAPPAPQPVNEDGHIWHEKVFSSMKIKCCMNCGFIKNEDQPNKPCPGPIGVGLRESAPAIPAGWFSQVVNFFVKHDMLDERDEYDINDVMSALVDNYEPTPIPAGWKLVPVEPTEEMIKHGNHAIYEAELHEDMATEEIPNYRATFAWTAMLAAAPTPEAWE